jgi:excisionase family DNA binding protein
MTQTIAGVEYLNVDEAAALLGVKKATLYAYVSRGLLRSYRQGVGRTRLYLCSEIEALRQVRARAGSQLGAEDGVLRDVTLMDAESWVSEH